MYHTYPSLKSAEDQAALWDGTARGSIHCIATDELCCTLKDKTVGNRIDERQLRRRAAPGRHVY
jgi:dihydropyrimidinase